MTDCGSIIHRARGIFAALQPRNRSVRLALAASASAPNLSFVASADSSTGAPDDAAAAEFTDRPISVEKHLASEQEDSATRGTLRSVGEQLSFGGILGYATGYSIRKVGKAALFFVGAEVVILQYMAYRQWVEVDWGRMGRDLSPKFSRTTWDGLVDILVYKMPFSAAFTGGLVAALRIPTTK